MDNKRIKLIHLLPSLDVGGREKIVFELAKRLDKRQFDIVVCCLRNHGKLYKLFKNENIKIKSFEKEKGVDMGLPFKLRKYFREQKAEIIHIHNPGALIYGAMGSIIGGNPVVLNTEHGFSYKEKLSVRILDQFFRNIIDMNICVSKKLKNELSSHIFFKQKIITIHNGAEVPSGKSNLLLSLKEKRKNNGFGDSDIIIGNIGRLKEVKNHHLLIKAMKNVIDKNRLVKLLIVGDGPLRGELEELTRSLKISKNVVFWGETENVHDLLDIMDIFVMSSVNEGLSITILEAMAHGKPVIATSVGGNPEIVVHNETGLLVSPFNVAEISRAIKLLLENRNRAELMGKKGRERVEKYFNIESMVDNIEKIYLALYEHKFKN